jgi:hypothetical protein
VRSGVWQVVAAVGCSNLGVWVRDRGGVGLFDSLACAVEAVFLFLFFFLCVCSTEISFDLRLALLSFLPRCDFY